MGFYSERKKMLDEGPREYRQIKKSLPYTVTPITDIKEWRLEQKIKQEAWDNGRDERYARSRQRAIDVLNGAQPTADRNAETYRQHQERTAEMIRRSCRPSEPTQVKLNVAPEQTRFQRIVNKVLNFFLDMKF